MNWDGSVPTYTEQCAGVMAVTYGQDMFTDGVVKPPLVSSQDLFIENTQAPFKSTHPPATNKVQGALDLQYAPFTPKLNKATPFIQVPLNTSYFSSVMPSPPPF